MSSSMQPDNVAAGHDQNGTASNPYHSRLSDLLDDVTIERPNGAEPAAVRPFGQPAGRSTAAARSDAQLPAADSAGNGGSKEAGPPSSSPPPTFSDSSLAGPLLLPADAASPRTAGEPPVAISIKGRADGLTVDVGKGTWAEILAALDDRLGQSASFFRNARVALDLGARSVVESDLEHLEDVLQKHTMTLGALRTSSERTFQAALALGLTATLEAADGSAVADASPAETNLVRGGYFVYRGYLRSGHLLQRSESIVVIGDVNPGAVVISGGDILVWGRLRGIVHAGATGNHRSIVAALDLEPTQLRIADVITVGPDPKPDGGLKWSRRRTPKRRPEVARIVDSTIYLDEWDTTRQGAFVSLRRGG